MGDAMSSVVVAVAVVCWVISVAGGLIVGVTGCPPIALHEWHSLLSRAYAMPSGNSLAVAGLRDEQPFALYLRSFNVDSVAPPVYSMGTPTSFRDRDGDPHMRAYIVSKGASHGMDSDHRRRVFVFRRVDSEQLASN